MDGVSAMTCEVFALTVDTIALALCVRKLLKWRSVLRDLQNAPNLEIDGNLKSQVQGEPDGTMKYVVLRGLVKPLGEPIKSNTNEKITGVVQKLSIKEHVVTRSSTGFWSDEFRTVYERFNIMPFVLTGNKMEVEIIDALEANVLDMDVITDRFEPLNPSLLDHIWGYFTGVRQRGLQTTEEMLRDGTFLTAIGELTTRSDSTLSLQPPKDGSPLFLVTSTKNSLMKKINESRDLLRILAIVFGSVAVVLSSRILIKYLRRRKKLQDEENLKKQLALTRRERRELAREKNLTNVQLCVVCAENPKEIILLPCGHVSLCENCSDNIRDKCPVCRMEISSKAPAFIT